MFEGLWLFFDALELSLFESILVGSMLGYGLAKVIALPLMDLIDKRRTRRMYDDLVAKRRRRDEWHRERRAARLRGEYVEPLDSWPAA